MASILWLWTLLSIISRVPTFWPGALGVSGAHFRRLGDARKDGGSELKTARCDGEKGGGDQLTMPRRVHSYRIEAISVDFIELKKARYEICPGSL